MSHFVANSDTPALKYKILSHVCFNETEEKKSVNIFTRPKVDVKSKEEEMKGDDEDVEDEEEEEVMTEEDLLELEYMKGGYSPRLFRPEELTIDAIIYDEQDDSKKLELARKQVFATGRVRVSFVFVVSHLCSKYLDN